MVGNVNEEKDVVYVPAGIVDNIVRGPHAPADINRRLTRGNARDVQQAFRPFGIRDRRGAVRPYFGPGKAVVADLDSRVVRPGGFHAKPAHVLKPDHLRIREIKGLRRKILRGTDIVPVIAGEMIAIDVCAGMGGAGILVITAAALRRTELPAAFHAPPGLAVQGKRIGNRKGLKTIGIAAVCIGGDVAGPIPDINLEIIGHIGRQAREHYKVTSARQGVNRHKIIGPPGRKAAAHSGCGCHIGLETNNR